MKSISFLAGIAIALAIAVAGCGVDTSDGGSTTSSGVSLPNGFEAESGTSSSHSADGSSEEELDLYYEGLLETGIKPEVAKCYRQHVEELSPAFLDELNANEVGAERVLRFNKGLERECVKPGTQAAEAHRSGDQLDKAGELLKNAIDPVLEEEGASGDQIDCVDSKIDELSDAEMEVFTSGVKSAKSTAIGNSIYEACRE